MCERQELVFAAIGCLQGELRAHLFGDIVCYAEHGLDVAQIVALGNQNVDKVFRRPSVL